MAQDFVRQFQYNVDIMPDRSTLSNMRKKPNESFREYAIKWREQAARVKPPLDEQELVDIFVEAQDPNYFHHLIATMGRPFHIVIKIGEMVKSGLKTGRIVSQAAIKTTTQAIQGGSGSFGNRKRKEEISSLASGSRGAQRNSNCPYPPLQGQSSYPQHYYPYVPQFPVSPSPYTVFHAQSYVHPPNRPHFWAQTQGNLRPQRPPYQLKKIGVNGFIPPHRLNPTALGFQANERYEYHSGTPGHNTDNFWTLKGAIEKLIDHGVVVVTDDQNTPNEYQRGRQSIKSSKPVASLSVEGVNLDTKVLCVPGVSKGIEVRAVEWTFVKHIRQLPVTDSKVVPWNYNKIVVVYRRMEIVEEVDEAGGLTRSGRCYSPEELRKGKMTQTIQVPFKKAVTEEEAEEFLNKIKVPDYSVVEQLKKTPAQISLLSLLLHSEEHRRVLNKILNEAHVSKETTVNQLEKMAKRIFESNTITFTDDKLPTEGAGHNRALLLTVKCEGHYVKRVMIDGGSGVDICPLFTLQSLKISPDRIYPSNVFVRAYDGLRRDTIGEIKLNMTIGPVDFMIVFQVMDMDTFYNFLLGRPWIHMAWAVPSTLHQVVKFEHNHQEIISFEAVSVDRFKEGDPIIQPCLSSFSSMVATTMLKYGTSGLGYKQSKRNGDKAKNHKRTDWALPQPIPHISYSFIKPQGPEIEAPFIHDDIAEVQVMPLCSSWAQGCDPKI
ncbi:hypothetical protein KY290_019637 [Solanum tuberosum]|uniref:Retrotransposon gag domain-containing protein n=1 Tax=Solanum tuberosum TaxID=4113 RepID=A0ABQ7VHM0_SOLTU|nr:hypothetical protein KY290_019637 [Solanum tuberosum]